MTDRHTSATAPGGPGIEEWGRKSRAEMIAEYRRYYRWQLAQAEQALAVPDEEITVETYRGTHVRSNIEKVS